MASKTQALEWLGRHSQRHPPQSEEVSVFTREVQRYGREEGSLEGSMTSLVILGVERYGPANEFPSTARHGLSEEVTHGRPAFPGTCFQEQHVELFAKTNQQL